MSRLRRWRPSARGARSPLVEAHLDGRDSELKESVIAVEVFGRRPDYGPKLDAIVRTEAMRLRARLSKYYADEGSRKPVIIDLPKGGYRPVFRPRAQGQGEGNGRGCPFWCCRVASTKDWQGSVTR